MLYQIWKNEIIKNYQSLYASKMEQFGIKKIVSDQGIIQKLIDNNIYASNNINKILSCYYKNEELAVIIGFGNNSNLHLGHLTLINEILFYLENFDDVVLYFVNLDICFNDKFVKEILSVLKNNYSGNIKYEILDREQNDVKSLEERISKNINISSIDRVMGWKNNTLDKYNKVLNMLTTFSINSVLREQNIIVITDINQATYYGLYYEIHKKLKLPMPSFMYHLLLPSLKSPLNRMSIKDTNSIIYLSDSYDDMKIKLQKSFTGLENKELTCSFLRIMDTVYNNQECKEKILAECCNGTCCSECKKNNMDNVITLIKTRKLR